MEELFRLADTAGSKKITADEVKHTKDYLTGKTILDFEDSESIANYYGSKQLLEGKITTQEEALAKISAVTFHNVQKVAKRLLDKNALYFAMIGPFESDEKFRKILGMK